MKHLPYIGLVIALVTLGLALGLLYAEATSPTYATDASVVAVAAATSQELAALEERVEQAEATVEARDADIDRIQNDANALWDNYFIVDDDLDAVIEGHNELLCEYQRNMALFADVLGLGLGGRAGCLQ